MTGTPLQNNLKYDITALFSSVGGATFGARAQRAVDSLTLFGRELWALLHFVAPNTFNNLDLFERWFKGIDWMRLKKGAVRMSRD
jgi:hypothetical protein